MKQIHGGTLYDTDTATKLAGVSSGSNYTDFSHWEEDLYVTDDGKYFIAGEGGPMTEYAVHHSGNTTSGGSKIKPIDSDEVLIWAEEHAQRLSDDETQKIFDHVKGESHTKPSAKNSRKADHDLGM